MLDFNTLLKQVNIDLSHTLIVRHVPIEQSLKRVLPWLVVERPELWLAYQRIQWESLEKAMTKGSYIASFIGQESGEATFAGLYEIGDWETLDIEGYQSFPGNSELEALGMSGRSPEMGDCLAFDLRPLDHYIDWVGRLSVEWPKPFQQWWRWAGRGVFPVATIEAESRFTRDMPDWTELVFSWNELRTLPTSWKAALGEWRGVYFIFDTRLRVGYVGSAYGADNILGRWMNYAKTGHGGNQRLKKSNPSDLVFTILERTSPDRDANDVIALESSWKLRLHTRESGLNLN